MISKQEKKKHFKHSRFACFFGSVIHVGRGFNSLHAWLVPKRGQLSFSGLWRTCQGKSAVIFVSPVRPPNPTWCPPGGKTKSSWMQVTSMRYFSLEDPWLLSFMICARMMQGSMSVTWVPARPKPQSQSMVCTFHEALQISAYYTSMLLLYIILTMPYYYTVLCTLLHHCF